MIRRTWRTCTAKNAHMQSFIGKKQPSIRAGFHRATAKPAAQALAELSRADVQRALRRHHLADWGDLDASDREANERALHNGGRFLSAYRSDRGEKFWIITEADRSATTVLMPGDY